MPNRRIIYLQNPSEGSHFRTLGGSTSPRGPKPPKPPKPPGTGTNTTTPPGTIELTGGAIYTTPDSDWHVATSEPQAPYYGELPGYGVDPNNETLPINEWEPINNLFASQWSIWVNHLDPNTGQHIPQFGEAGWEPFNPFNPGGEMSLPFGDPPKVPPRTNTSNVWNPFR